MLIKPGYKNGSLAAPPSKSFAHRALICAGLCEDDSSEILNTELSQDIKATVSALKVLKNGGGVINCGSSASTLRFLTPVAAALGVEAVFTGENRLFERPDIYPEILKNKKLCPGRFFIPGNISSQFITGLMFALPLLGGDSEIILTSPLESEAYADMTIEVLSVFGVNIGKGDMSYTIKGGQKYKSAVFKVEGDYSQAAYFACMAVVNGDIKIYGLNPASMQGDYKIIELLREFGAEAGFCGDALHVKNCGVLRGIEIDASQNPDIIPALAAAAAYAEGKSIIYNAERLRFKESDRLHAMCGLLTSAGAEVSGSSGGLTINGNGGKRLCGGAVKTYNDHRIAMSAAVAAIGTEAGITVDDADCVNKSYPGFWRDFMRL
ncbi:MAG: 3-phosphoshikimate 1-carboxyvinyltransferase [Oscillospiraceae bacterium]|nr:3-phosphoshikimate 1-carboxyvinyltransferase [Oscillospiraceae bacterium]